MAFFLGTFRRVSLGALVALSAASAGCQLVFGLDDYGPRSEGQGGDGGRDSTTSSVTVGAGGAAPCAPLAAEAVSPTAPGICGAQRLAALADDQARDLAPGAYCNGKACYVYFERRITGQDDALMCSYCSDLGAGICDQPKVLKTVLNNPYLRVFPSPEIWVAQNGQIAHAPVNVNGGCTMGALEPITGAITPGFAIYPAISPNGKVLLFTRNDPTDGTERIWISRRESETGPFDTAKILPGLHDAGKPLSHDLRAQPVWTGDESFDTIYFSSSRLSATPKEIDELDVMVAHRPAASAFDAPFTDVAIVSQLSGPAADFAPVPLAANTWLWAARPDQQKTDSGIFRLDLGCEPRFTAPDAAAFAVVNTAGNDEDAPAILGADLFFSRAAPNGYAGLYRATKSGETFGAATPVKGLATPAKTSDRQPFALKDGRLLFVSDRSSVDKIWIADPALGSVTRATTEADTVAEGTPFVDEDGSLWLSRGVGAAGVIAVAPPSGAAWGKAAEVKGLGHAAGARDESPRLLPDGLTLVFASTRPGGFFPGASTIWAATRPALTSSAWSAFPLPELGGINGAFGPSISRDGCSIAVARSDRATSYRRDLAGSIRVSP